MTIDPRTLREITEYADCHLIPACFGVSNLTVPLDKDFDSKIGAFCDVELEKWIRMLIGSELHGKVAVGGWSKSLTATLDLMKGHFHIPKPRSADLKGWATRALGFQDGKVHVEGFVGESADVMAASLSTVNSAMLVLHYQGWNLTGPEFDKPRELLASAAHQRINEADYKPICEMTWLGIVFDSTKAKSQLVTQEDLRNLYDPTFDPGDGLLNDFPNKCISEEKDDLIVRIPYSRSLRGLAKFSRNPTS